MATQNKEVATDSTNETVTQQKLDILTRLYWQYEKIVLHKNM